MKHSILTYNYYTMQTRSATAAASATPGREEKNASYIYCNMFKNIIKNLWSISSIYIMWIIIHHAASQLYANYCTPVSVIGILFSPFVIATPHCVGLRWCIRHGADAIMTMWVVIGSWGAKRIMTTHE